MRTLSASTYPATRERVLTPSCLFSNTCLISMSSSSTCPNATTSGRGLATSTNFSTASKLYGTSFSEKDSTMSLVRHFSTMSSARRNLLADALALERQTTTLTTSSPLQRQRCRTKSASGKQWRCLDATLVISAVS